MWKIGIHGWNPSDLECLEVSSKIFFNKRCSFDVTDFEKTLLVTLYLYQLWRDTYTNYDFTCFHKRLCTKTVRQWQKMSDMSIFSSLSLSQSTQNFWLFIGCHLKMLLQLHWLFWVKSISYQVTFRKATLIGHICIIHMYKK